MTASRKMISQAGFIEELSGVFLGAAFEVDQLLPEVFLYAGLLSARSA